MRAHGATSRAEAEAVDRLRAARVRLGAEVAALEARRDAVNAERLAAEAELEETRAAILRSADTLDDVVARTVTARAEHDAVERRRRNALGDLAETYGTLGRTREQLVTAERTLEQRRIDAAAEEARLRRLREERQRVQGGPVRRTAYDERFPG